MAHEIECIIDNDGTVHIDLIGYEGQGCDKVANEIIRALGKKVDSKTKPEYYKTDAKATGKQKQTLGF